MQNVLKQFAEKAIGLRNNQFQLTRLRLTAMYAALLLAVFLISGLITHSVFSNRLEHRGILFRDRSFPPPSHVIEIGREARLKVRRELATSILLVNSTLFVGSVGLSYLLAGLTLKPIQRMYNKQRQFMSDASHELRTPLAILQTDLENELVNPKLKKAEKENLQSHLEEVKRMGNIVKDLLLISRLDNHETSQARKEPVDLKELVLEAVERLEGYAHAHMIKLITPPRDGQEKVITLANREHLLQALSNIVKNGIDYNQPDGTVTISLKHGPEKATISVTDTGIGIAENEIPKLFDRFYRVDKNRTREAGGNGLGLSIVQSIVHTYSGEVAIDSQAGKGTTVQISFPVKS